MDRPDLRHALRVPLFTRVEATGPVQIGHAYSWNISEGGVYLKAPEAKPLDVIRGTRLAIEFHLPGDQHRLHLAGEVAWADPEAMDHHGRRSLGLGLKFDDGQEHERERLHRFIETFRYRVVVVGFEREARAPIDDAIGKSFEVLAPGDDAALEKSLATSAVGLIVVNEGHDALEGASRLERVMSSATVMAQPPIIYFGGSGAPPAALVHHITRKGRVVYLPKGAHALALHTLAQRLVESHMLTLENDLLTGELERTLRELRAENQSLRRLVAPSPMPGMIGDSPAIQRLYELAERVAPLETSVLIHGESGTGKEVLARAIHAKSQRAGRVFMAQNCAALTDNLLDDELFGHMRGAFTGAVANRPGLLEAAQGGTVFLDEIGEMTAPMQAKLLRVIEDREVRRIGATNHVKIDVRIICATHRDLDALVKQGTFREDLVYRLRSFVLTLPPLRDRKSDVQALAQHFLDAFCRRHERTSGGFTPEAMRLLEEHPWPGNVRELQHEIERLLILSDKSRPIGAALVQETLGLVPPRADGQAPVDAKRTLDQAVLEYERQLIIAELDRAGGVLAKAARALGIDRTTLSKRCKRLGLTAEEPKS